VYHNNADLRTEIANRFRWTLELDDRYLVIAYSMAFSLKSGSMPPEGVDADDIRRMALDSWPVGFEGLSRERLVALLDEMIKLGILRKDDTAYNFRSPNVPLLMGSEDDILAILMSERPTPEAFDADIFRESNAEQDRSPLTERQLGELRAATNGVAVLVGSPALDLHLVAEFLGRGGSFVAATHCRSRAEFAAFCEELLGREEGTTIAMVPETVPWDETWIEFALGKIRSYTAPRKYVRFVFSANPEHVWDLICGKGLLHFESSGVDLMSLERWHPSTVRDWIRDCQIQLEPASQKHLVDVTEGLPWLLHRFRDEMQGPAFGKEAIEALEDRMSTNAMRESYRKALGLEKQLDSVTAVLRVMADANDALDFPFLRDLIADELSAKVDDTTLANILVFAERLSIVRRQSEDRWILEPDAVRMLSE
jgi:hypothetical protein